MEAALLKLGDSKISPCPIFVLAAPRSGSTYLYQVIADVFKLPYISNLTNDHFASNPIVGLALQRGVKEQVGLQSEFGKTKGLFQPSEGSGPMTFWFGGGQPSQVMSSRILEGREAHFIMTLAACEVLYDGAPLVIKNAWNCFRVSYLATRLPGARFIWLKRDIHDASLSDLEARYLTKGDPNAWNSATPSNVEALSRLPPTQQVVENQYEFNRAIANQLNECANGRWLSVWYEDCIQNPEDEIERMASFLGLPTVGKIPPSRDLNKRSLKLEPSELGAVTDHINSNRARFGEYCYL